MEGKNEEGRNRGGLGIGASWFFGGREREKKKNWKIKMEKKEEKKRRKKKREKKKEKSDSLGSRTYRIVTRLRTVWGNRDWGAKREKIGEKKWGETSEMG
jgi:hypothetical protein